MQAQMKRQPWRNRIVGSGEQEAGQFMANPMNWRIHPKAQRDALTGILSDVGWVQSVIVNRTTGHVLDGHARIEEALKLGDETPVPFVEVELSEEEEQKILLTLDPISAMAAADKANLEQLLRDVSTDNAALSAMLEELAEQHGVLDALKDGVADGQTEDDEKEESVELNIAAPDIAFPSDNIYGIPALLPQGNLAGIPRPCERWGMRARGSANPGSLHFYTDDARFETVWKKPEWIINSGVSAITEPNITTHPANPLAWVIWGIYRKRWLARWAQQYGIFIFVDLNVEPMFYEYNLLGVPKGWKHYSTRGYDKKPEMLTSDWECAVKHAGTSDIVFVVFGGGKGTHDRCISEKWIHIPQESHIIENRYGGEMSDGRV